MICAGGGSRPFRIASRSAAIERGPWAPSSTLRPRFKLAQQVPTYPDRHNIPKPPALNARRGLRSGVFKNGPELLAANRGISIAGQFDVGSAHLVRQRRGSSQLSARK